MEKTKILQSLFFNQLVGVLFLVFVNIFAFETQGMLDNPPPGQKRPCQRLFPASSKGEEESPKTLFNNTVRDLMDSIREEAITLETHEDLKVPDTLLNYTFTLEDDSKIRVIQDPQITLVAFSGHFFTAFYRYREVPEHDLLALGKSTQRIPDTRSFFSSDVRSAFGKMGFPLPPTFLDSLITGLLSSSHLHARRPTVDQLHFLFVPQSPPLDPKRRYDAFGLATGILSSELNCLELFNTLKQNNPFGLKDPLLRQNPLVFWWWDTKMPISFYPDA